jgi:hypothetical protein
MGSSLNAKFGMVSTHIDKLDFLAVYPIARDKAFTDDAIRNGFKSTSGAVQS